METLLNQFVFFGFFQSILLLGIYVFSPERRRNISGYLAVLIAVLLLGLSGKILNSTAIFGTSSRFIALSEFANLLFGSTVYLFTRSSLQKKRFNKQDLLHYVPALVYSSFIVVLFVIPSADAVRARFQGSAMRNHILLFIGVALVVNVAYWFASFRIFIKFRRNMKAELSYVVKSAFFRNFLVAIGLCWLTWIGFYLFSALGYEFIEPMARNYIWTSITLIILFISFYTLREPELFRLSEKIQVKKYAQSRLTEDDLNALKMKLDQLMVDKKPYLNRKLMKADLSKMLGINEAELSRLLNENIGMNFFEYVNYYRIKEFVSLAKTEKAQQLTFYGLAQEAGFNSKTTFNKSFKHLMGSSPSTYFKQQN